MYVLILDDGTVRIWGPTDKVRIGRYYGVCWVIMWPKLNRAAFRDL